jgi:hypothetical protein
MPTDTLRAELGAAEQRKKALVGELEALTGRRQAGASLDVERLRRDLVRHAREIRTLLGQDIPRARKILRRLLVGRLGVRPSRRASGSAIASRRGARTRRYSPPRSPHLKW